MSPTAVTVLAANMIFDTGGHIAFKAASSRAAHLDGAAHWRSLLLNPLLCVGLAAFAVEFLLWLALLSLVPLAEGILVGCVNIIGVMVGGALCFGEPITRSRLAAILLIATGVGLVGWGAAV